MEGKAPKMCNFQVPPSAPVRKHKDVNVSYRRLTKYAWRHTSACYDINAIKHICHLCMRYSTGQQKCEERGWSHHPDDFRVDSRLVRWALASCTRATPLKKPTLHCQEDCCTQPWGSGADGALTKGFSDLTIVGMDPSKTKYAPYCPEIVTALFCSWQNVNMNVLSFYRFYVSR